MVTAQDDGWTYSELLYHSRRVSSFIMFLKSLNWHFVLEICWLAITSRWMEMWIKYVLGSVLMERLYFHIPKMKKKPSHDTLPNLRKKQILKTPDQVPLSAPLSCPVFTPTVCPPLPPRHSQRHTNEKPMEGRLNQPILVIIWVQDQWPITGVENHLH